MSDPTTSKALVTEFIDALFTRGDLNAVDRYLAPGFVNHDPFPGFAPDLEGFRRIGQVFREGFPDWHSQLEALIAEGDLVTERFTARGTHRGTTGSAGVCISVGPTRKVAKRWIRTGI